ncbi:hypothetical protein VTN49DRAFT_36 [Thermomyces lanuginosus]|uniref:uncharacterized protein n=1 Tax=Thermomyces lanuginosus TaxID=5541 RepID=UPI003741F324
MSWLDISPTSPFSLDNIPFGVCSAEHQPEPRVAVAIGDYAFNLCGFADANGFKHLPSIQPHLDVFRQSTLNAFAALGRTIHRQVRQYLREVFQKDTPYPDVLKDNKALQDELLVPLKYVRYHVPLKIGDYTDFYAGLNHARNMGSLLRPSNPLMPNYKHLPVAYHGRASSVVVSGTPIVRPRGQVLEKPFGGTGEPFLSPSRWLDFELELAAFVCRSNKLGQPVSVDEADEYIFGFVLMNDWSARDIQAWEYVPLGPFNAKNFATTISPWVVLPDALEPFRTQALEPADRESILPYLREKRASNVYDIKLEVELRPAGATEKTRITTSNAKNLLYSFPQMIAHHTIGGCNLQVGDLLGSGTISGPEPGMEGSLVEKTKGGKEPITLADGSKRVFLMDGDEVTLRAIAGSEGAYVGFGDCVGTVLPAVDA